jgi:type II secretory pathway pseudopilin PulG
VVIVILGILAAIAVPALTGYIAKSEDTKWEMQARDSNVAVRTVLIDQIYAKGTSGLSDSAKAYINNGATGLTGNFKWFDAGWLSNAVYGSWAFYYDEANELTGLQPIAYVPWWEFAYLAPTGSSHTAFDAAAFVYFYFPEGRSNDGNFNDPITVVTYNVSGFNGSNTDTWNTFNAALKESSSPNPLTYDPEAGYHVIYDMAGAP